MSLSTFFATILTALALENAVFTRALGLNRWVDSQNEPKSIFLFGGLFTWIAFFSTLGSMIVLRLVEGSAVARFLRAPGFLFATLLVYLGTYLLAKRFLPLLLEQMLIMLPIATLNTALFGIFNIVFNRNYVTLRALAYAIGTGIGYTLALLILLYGRKRLALCPVPRSFRGAPIQLIYIGLLSLALYGLLGYGGTA